MSRSVISTRSHDFPGCGVAEFKDSGKHFLVVGAFGYFERSRELVGGEVVGLLGYHLAHEGARFYKHFRHRAHNLVNSHERRLRKLCPGRIVVARVEFRYDFAEKQDKECEEHRLQDEAPHGAHACENRAEGVVTQHYNGNVDEVVGNKYRCQQSLRVGHQPSYAGASGIFVEFVELSLGEREISHFATAYKTRHDEASQGEQERNHLSGPEIRSVKTDKRGNI